MIYKKVGYLGKEVYNTPACSLIIYKFFECPCGLTELCNLVTIISSIWPFRHVFHAIDFFNMDTPDKR